MKNPLEFNQYIIEYLSVQLQDSALTSQLHCNYDNQENTSVDYVDVIIQQFFHLIKIYSSVQ